MTCQSFKVPLPHGALTASCSVHVQASSCAGSASVQLAMIQPCTACMCTCC